MSNLNVVVGSDLNVGVVIGGGAPSLSNNTSNVTGQNIGTGNGVFYAKDGNALLFKSIVAGQNVSISVDSGNLVLNAATSGSSSVDWGLVTNKPTTFTPEQHTHDLSGVNGLTGTLSGLLNQTGNYYLKNNVNQFVNSGSFINTGNSLYSLISQLSGNSDSKFYLLSNPNDYSNSGNLFSTGNNLYLLLTNASGQILNYLSLTGSILDSKANVLSGFVTSNYVTNSIFGNHTGRVINFNSLSGFVNLVATGNNFLSVNGNSIIISGSGVIPDLSNYVTLAALDTTSGILNSKIDNSGAYLFGLINSSSAGISSINTKSGILSLTGAGTVSVIVNGQNFIFSGDTGYLSNYALTNDLISTGEILNTKITSLSGYTSNSIGATNINLQLTGNNLYNYILSVSGNTGYLIQYAKVISLESTGSYLYGLIQSNSAGVGSINGQSGTLNYTGAGNTSVIVNGQNFTISGDVSNLYLKSNPNNFSTTGDLQNSGIALDSKINVLSGYTVSSFVRINDTGAFTGAFYPRYSNPLGYLDSTNSGHLQTQILNTGNNLFGLINGLTNSYTILNNKSGNLNITGFGTNSVIVSGQLLIVSGSTGHLSNYALISNLESTGSSLQSQLNIDINNLRLTGANLYSLIQASSAGISSINGKSGILSITGAGAVSVFSDTNSFIISGNTGYLINYALVTDLFNTGSNLSNRINGTGNLTGAFYPLISNPAGYLTNLSGLSVNYVTGISGYLNQRINTVESNLQSTGSYLYNLIGASSAGVSTVNNLSGQILITGAGNNTVIVSGQTILVSGAATNLSNYALNSDLFNTGNNLSIRIAGTGNLTGSFYPLLLNPAGYLNTLSGLSISYVTGISGDLSNQINNTNLNLFNTGLSLTNRINGTGNLTGSFYPLTFNPAGYLNTLSGLSIFYVTGISGFLNDRINTTNSNLQNTGSYLLGLITNNVSGNFINYYLNSNPNNYSNSGNLSATGSVLNSKIDVLSGYGNSTFATITNLGLTGQQLYFNFTGLDFAIKQTGILLDSKINALSGYTNTELLNYYLKSNPNNFATSGNLQSTGSILNSKIDVLSGFVLSNTGSGGSVNTGSLTGAFYPRYENPSGYIASTGGNIYANGSVTIQNGEFLIGHSGDNSFNQGNIYKSTGIYINSGAGSLGIGINPNELVTGLVAGSNVTITPNGAGLFTIAAAASTGGGGGGNYSFGWNVISSGGTTLAVNSGYICSGAGQFNLTLPTVSSFGDTFKVAAKSNGAIFKIIQNSNQIMYFGMTNTVIGTGGFIQSLNNRNSLEFICLGDSGIYKEFQVVSSIGNFDIN